MSFHGTLGPSEHAPHGRGTEIELWRSEYKTESAHIFFGDGGQCYSEHDDYYIGAGNSVRCVVE